MNMTFRPEPTADGLNTAEHNNYAGGINGEGQAWLAELGMYHCKARMYSPTLGQFLQTDPIGYDDQQNLYAYVGNDPLNGVDPTGKQAQAAPIVVEVCTGPQVARCVIIGAGVSGIACALTPVCPERIELGVEQFWEDIKHPDIRSSIAPNYKKRDEAIRTENDGKVHGKLPDADDVDPNDSDDSIENLNNNIVKEWHLKKG